MVIRTHRDFSRRVDEVGVIALPYLVFAEDKFKVKLSRAMAAVVHDYLRFNIVTLQSLIDRVMDMIEEYRHSDIAGTDNIQTIDMYASELLTQEDRFRQLNEKVDALIKKSQSIKKSESKVITQPDQIPDRISAITSMHTENLSPEIPIESSCSNLIIEEEAIIPEQAIITLKQKCPSCGKYLKCTPTKGGETYHCFESNKGCGKIYVLGLDDVLVEKTIITNQSYICQCGTKLHPQGKIEIDGESYQRYSCEPSTKDGCGKGYIMDKEGDLHVGISKIALSRPKISK